MKQFKNSVKNVYKTATSEAKLARVNIKLA